MTACPICNHINPVGTARCENCDTWLAQATDVGLKPQVRSEPTSAASPLTPEFAEQLLALTREGHMIEAIKLFREATGLGLRESKDAVEALMAGRSLPNAERAAASVTEEPVLALLRAGNALGAIKEYRTQTGLGLKNAKLAVEALARTHGVPMKQVGCGAAALTLATFVAGSLIAAASLWAR